ncbi:hypothetical protein PSOL_01290 [Candidatus Phytoplasma solani]
MIVKPNRKMEKLALKRKALTPLFKIFKRIDKKDNFLMFVINVVW